MEKGPVEYKVHRSEGDSRTELLFIPGPLNPELWKHQVKYFSNQFTVTTYKVSGGYQRELVALEDVLEESENVVLVSYGPGNSLAQYFEDRDNVIATVLTNASPGISIPGRAYRFGLKTVGSNAKLAGKLFFSDSAEYGTVKNFLKDLEPPSYDDFRSYTEGFGLREPLKDSLFLSAGSDRFSNIEFSKELKANADLSVLETAGTFPFYEKPEDYNKALFDFMLKVEDFAQSQQVREAREDNRTLDSEFEKKNSRDSSLERFAEQKIRE